MPVDIQSPTSVPTTFEPLQRPLSVASSAPSYATVDPNPGFVKGVQFSIGDAIAQLEPSTVHGFTTENVFLSKLPEAERTKQEERINSFISHLEGQGVVQKTGDGNLELLVDLDKSPNHLYEEYRSKPEVNIEKDILVAKSKAFALHEGEELLKAKHPPQAFSDLAAEIDNIDATDKEALKAANKKFDAMTQKGYAHLPDLDVELPSHVEEVINAQNNALAKARYENADKPEELAQIEIDHQEKTTKILNTLNRGGYVQISDHENVPESTQDYVRKVAQEQNGRLAQLRIDNVDKTEQELSALEDAHHAQTEKKYKSLGTIFGQLPTLHKSEPVQTAEQHDDALSQSQTSTMSNEQEDNELDIDISSDDLDHSLDAKNNNYLNNLQEKYHIIFDEKHKKTRFFEKGANPPKEAFSVQQTKDGLRLKTKEPSMETAKGMVEALQAQGSTAVRIRAHGKNKKEREMFEGMMYAQAMMAKPPLDVIDYKPTKIGLAYLEELRDQERKQGQNQSDDIDIQINRGRKPQSQSLAEPVQGGAAAKKPVEAAPSAEPSPQRVVAPAQKQYAKDDIDLPRRPNLAGHEEQAPSLTQRNVSQKGSVEVPAAINVSSHTSELTVDTDRSAGASAAVARGRAALDEAQTAATTDAEKKEILQKKTAETQTAVETLTIGEKTKPICELSERVLDQLSEQKGNNQLVSPGKVVAFAYDEDGHKTAAYIKPDAPKSRFNPVQFVKVPWESQGSGDLDRINQRVENYKITPRVDGNSVKRSNSRGSTRGRSNTNAKKQ